MEKELVKLYKSGISVNKLQKKFHIGNARAKEILQSNGIRIRSRAEGQRLSFQNDFIADEGTLKILEGELLGDASMYGSKYQSGFVFANSKKDYIIWLYNILKTLEVPISKSGVTKISQYDKRTSKVYIRYGFRTQCTKQFHMLKGKWYDAVKAVPNDIVISKALLLHWWLGDGTVASRCAFLCTDAFTEKEVVGLSRKINNYLDVDTKCT